MHWTAAPEKDTATLSRFHPALPPEAINTVIDKLTRDRSAMRVWREVEQMSVLSPPVYGSFDPPWTLAVLRRYEMMPRTEEVAGPSAALNPLGRIGEPAEVASAICWLLDGAQASITGQVIGVDGGLGSVQARA